MRSTHSLNRNLPSPRKLDPRWKPIGIVARKAFVALFFVAVTSSVHAGSVFIEELTWKEVSDQIAQGKTTAIIFAGSTEQNGLHMVLGKHNYIARHLAQRLAIELGDALVYPVFPFAPTGDTLTRTGHMRFAGSVNVNESLFAAVIGEIALSAISSGFKLILLMGDHGGGQGALASLAKRLDEQTRQSGIRVFHLSAIYDSTETPPTDMPQGLAFDQLAHAGVLDTASLMAIDAGRRWVRAAQMSAAAAANGADENPSAASAEMGQQLLARRVSAALLQVHKLVGDKP